MKGEGNQQDYGMRVYDGRLGRFLSVDPLRADYPWNSTYSYAEGDPVNYEDIDGLERPAIRPVARTSPTRPTLSNLYVNSRGDLVRVNAPIGAGSPPGLMPNEGVARSYRGYYVTTPNGGFYVPDTRKEIELTPYRTPQQAQFDIGVADAQVAYSQFRQNLSSERVTNDPSNYTEDELAEARMRLSTGQANVQDLRHMGAIIKASGQAKGEYKKPELTISGEANGIVGGYFTYSDGKITEFLAEKKVSGNTLELTSMVFYPKGAKGNELKNEFGSRQIIETLGLLKQYAKNSGFERLRIQYQRAENSSSRNLGHVEDKTFNVK